ncbi:MAG: hypothetical protein ABTQ27_01240, partial [Amaricoccus sp.]
GTPVEAIERMVIDWPSSRLAQVTLIDTPGLDSITTTNSARTHAFLGTEGDGEGEADAVIYLMRHVHRTDLTFLEAFRDDTQAGASPISALAVAGPRARLLGPRLVLGRVTCALAEGGAS